MLHPDVAQAVSEGAIKSGREHYNQYGRDEKRALRGRADPQQGRIVITGTGRAGTTLLVQLFTALGFNTGYTLNDALTLVDKISLAGLENLLTKESPVIVKSPYLTDTLFKDLAEHDFGVLFAIIPIRKLEDAAESRRRVHGEAIRQGLDPYIHPGALWLTDDPALQEERLALQHYKAVYALAKYRVRTFSLAFPDYAYDISYCFRALESIWEIYGVSQAEFVAAFGRVVDVSKITKNTV